MTTDQNTDFAETGDMNAQGEEQLSQEFERSEGTPSWGEQNEDPKVNFEEEPEGDYGQNEEPYNEVSTEEDTVDNEQQEETLPENPRRVLSFNDYFGN
jgi:hypothetical protein